MSREIFLIQSDGQLVPMREQAYESEALLQGLLESYPHLLVGDQIDPAQPCQWLLISRESSLPSEEGGSGRWAVDHLFLDQNAVPTLVEVKRSSDTRIRREVVGQMLDYAANAVVYWPIEALQAQFRVQCQRRGTDPETVLDNFLKQIGEQDPALFWQKAKTNLQAGKIRLLFVADEIPAELRRIVEFLNEQMDPAEVLAIEIKQYLGEGVRTLVPTVVGQTAEAQQRKTGSISPARQWDEPSFFQALQERCGAPEIDAARQILEWAKAHATRIWWGQGQRSASFIPVLQHGGIDYQLFAVYSYGKVEIYFQHFLSKPPFDSEEKRLELRRRLTVIEGVAIPIEAIVRRPSVELAVLADPTRVSAFLAVFDWFVDEEKAQTVQNI